jgi:acyl-coenzyme A thioesterase PaaI-like protein
MKFSIGDAGTGQIKQAWALCEKVPGGPRLFDRLVKRLVPYTGSIDARVISVVPGRAEILLPDRRAVRNHLGCVHAIALANLAEYAGNLAFAFGMPDDARFIVAGMSLAYKKKARGAILGIGEAPIITTNEKREYEVRVRMLDESAEEVTVATLRTLVGPARRAG